jgi:catechol 2,3-dioxygenase-like lactoylglutathione lyase family enzyme
VDDRSAIVVAIWRDERPERRDSMTRIDFEESKAGIHSISHFALNVPDLAEAERFLTTFGLRVERGDHLLKLRASGSDHIWALILPGERKRFAYLSVGCYERDFDAIKAQILAAGGKPATPHPHGEVQGFWFLDVDDTLVQLVVAAKTMPDSKAQMADMNVPANVRGAPARSVARKVRPTWISHMALFTPDVTRAVDFYTRALGVRLADRSGDIIAFTYGRHGSDHHLLAFLSGGGNGLHHSSWDTPSVEELGLGNTQMRAGGYTQHWGPGRHVLGSNYFNYVKDSFGQWWEYSSHIDYIAKDADWMVANFADEDALYLWGPDMPSDFPTNMEL